MYRSLLSKIRDRIKDWPNIIKGCLFYVILGILWISLYFLFPESRGVITLGIGIIILIVIILCIWNYFATLKYKPGGWKNFWITIAGIIFMIFVIWIIGKASDWANRTNYPEDEYIDWYSQDPH